MKIQCSCGAKYSFDVTPENAGQPVRFVCPACGVDSSDLVNELIRRELSTPADAAATGAPEAPAVKTPRLRVAVHPAADAPAPTDPSDPADLADAPGVVFCSKHSHVPATEKCLICHKPICPQCMALFGYFCSPYCKSKAEAANLKVPTYAGLAWSVEARFWRRVWRVAGGLAVLVGLALVGLVWYNFYGALPHAVFSMPFAQHASAGACRLAGADQLIFLHGGTLARCDLKTKQTVWTQELITQKDVDALAARLSEMQSGEEYRKSGVQLQSIARRTLEAGLTLTMADSNVWVGNEALATRYDWDTGRAVQSVPLLTDNLAAAGAPDNAGGLPTAGGTPGRPLDPNKAADQAQSLTSPGRLALPALMANNVHQQQLMEAMRDEPSAKPKPTGPAATPPRMSVITVSGPAGLVQCSVELLEPHYVTRSAMKAPGKSVMTGDLNAGQGTAAVNETLNEMQRNNGGGTITEDQSRYRVTLRRDGVPDWTGEVTGLPAVYPLKTVVVIAAGSSVTVLDQAGKKIWAASLTYNVAPARTGAGGAPSPYGLGPCVEQGDTLYVVDEAVLTAFDLTSGNARWRLPSVGIVGLFIDDRGMLYVNTTTASPDKIKYSRQIDVEESIDAVLLKVDPRTGRNLWTAKTGGYAAYVSGPYIYTLQSHDKPEDDYQSDLIASLGKPSFLKLVRLDPQTGRILWEHDDTQAPLDIGFDHNTISLVFHGEVQVLRYLNW